MAQGAAQAIEDGAVLAACSDACRILSVEDALKRYEAIRKPRASEIQALARRNAQPSICMMGLNNRRETAGWLRTPVAAMSLRSARRAA